MTPLLLMPKKRRMAWIDLFALPTWTIKALTREIKRFRANLDDHPILRHEMSAHVRTLVSQRIERLARGESSCIKGKLAQRDVLVPCL